jgi:hypothetical protein
VWLTIIVISVYCLYITFLFQRNKYFFLHSIFLIPLYPSIFFIDHNAHFVYSGLESDSVHYVAKLLPLYLNTIYLALRFKSKKLNKLSLTIVVVNVVFMYNFILSIVYSVYHSSMLPFFYASYSIPLFVLFFNSCNFMEEVADIRQSVTKDIKVLQIYFIGFIFIYVTSIYYSIMSGITSSLLDSRGVGSVFASTSALVYCFLYAPLLSTLTGKKWPHIVTIIIGVTSLSKTAFLVVPAYLIVCFRKFKKNISRSIVYFSIGAALIIVLVQQFAPPALLEMWEIKFALGNDETLLDKSYMTRVDIYKDALEVIHDFPFGIGVGNFEKYSHGGYRDPHNFMLNALSESGLLFGSLLILVILICFVKTIIQISKGIFGFNHFSLVTIFAVYTTASGVLLITGTSEFSTQYYTPFYGVVIFQLLSMANSNGVKQL